MSKNLLDVDPASYEKMTAVPPKIIGDILSAAHNAYLATLNSPQGQARGLTYDSVKSASLCYFVAERMGENFAKMGYEANWTELHLPPENTWHVVSAIKTPEFPDQIITDGTWQQFLPQRRARRLNVFRKPPTDYPDVLIGTSAEVAKVAMRFGFSKSQASMWTPDPNGRAEILRLA